MMLFRGYPMHSHHMPCIMSQMLIFTFLFNNYKVKLCLLGFGTCIVQEVWQFLHRKPLNKRSQDLWVGIPHLLSIRWMILLHKLSISNQAPIAQDGNLKKHLILILLPSLSHSLLCLIFAPGITYQTTYIYVHASDSI